MRSLTSLAFELPPTRTQKLALLAIGVVGGTFLPILLKQFIWWSRIPLALKFICVALTYGVFVSVLWRRWRYVALGVAVSGTVLLLIWAAGIGLWLLVRLGGL